MKARRFFLFTRFAEMVRQFPFPFPFSPLDLPLYEGRRTSSFFFFPSFLWYRRRYFPTNGDPERGAEGRMRRLFGEEEERKIVSFFPPW